MSARWSWLRLVCGACLMLVLGRTGLAADDDELRSVVKRLGAERFAEREAAAAELTKARHRAKAFLVEGTRSADAEIARRSRRLIKTLLEEELQALVTSARHSQVAFHSLPGWSRFRDVVGDSLEARRTFLEMVSVESGLMLATDLGNEAALQALRQRMQQFLQAQFQQDPTRRRVPASYAVLAMVYVAGHKEAAQVLNVQDVSILRSWMMNGESDFSRLLSNRDLRPIVSSIVVAWVRSCFGREAVVGDRTSDAMYLDLDERLKLEIALEAFAQQPVPSIYTLELIGRYGGKDYAEYFVPLLANQTVISSVNVNEKAFSIELRDMCLAWLVHLTGQNMPSYGFQYTTDWFRTLKQQRGVNPSVYRFETAEARQAALKKWAEWSAKNRLKPAPPVLPELREEPPVATPVANPLDVKPEQIEEQPGFDLADSFVVQRLNRAKSLMQERRFLEAATLLTDLVAKSEGLWYQPQRGVPQYREVRSEAERLLREFPEEGLAVIEQQFGELSRKKLEAAWQARDIDALGKLARDSFVTAAGAEATYRLASLDLDAGRWLPAVMGFERIVAQSRHRANWEPQLSLKRAICWARMGLVSPARRVLSDLKATHPDVRVRWRGEDKWLFASTTETNFSEQWLSLYAINVESPTDTRTHRGQNDRNRLTQSVAPWMEPASADLLTAEFLSSQVAHLLAEDAKQKLQRLSTLGGVVLNGTVIYRTPIGLRAVDARGECLWEAPQEDLLWELLQPNAADRRVAQLPAMLSTLRERLWDDSTFGAVASNGRLVFVIESDRVQCSPDYQRFIVTPDGRLSLNDRPASQANTLAAYDAVTGKLVWERIGGRVSGERPSGEVSHLGVPLLLANHAFVMVGIGDQTLLQELDAQTGQLKRQWPLQTTPQEAFNLWAVRLGIRSQDPAQASTPSFEDGLILCRTPWNRLVAIDLTTGSSRWTYQVPRQERTNQTNFVAIRLAEEQRRVTPVDRWRDASLIVAEGRVVAGLPNSHVLSCLDLKTGELLWSVPREDGLVVQGVAQGKVIVVGRTEARALRLSDGRSAWPAQRSIWPNGATPSGFGYLSAERCVVPLSTGEVVSVDVATGRLMSRSSPAVPAVPQNLLVTTSDIISIGPDGLRRFPTTEQHLARLKAETSSSATPSQRRQLAQVLMASGAREEAIDLLIDIQRTEPSADSPTRELLLALATDPTPLPVNVQRKLMTELDIASLPVASRWKARLNLLLALEQSDRNVDALWQLLDFVPGLQTDGLLQNSEQLRQESAVWHVRHDCWMRGKLADLERRLSEDDRRDWLQRVDAFRQTQSPEISVTALGSQRSLAKPSRLAWAEQLAIDGLSLEAELQFRLARDSARPHERADLLKKLLSLNHSPLPMREPHWARQLKDELPEDDDNPKAALELAKQLRKLEASERPAWPAIKPQVTSAPMTTEDLVREVNYSALIAVTRSQPDVDGPMWLAYEQAKRKWCVLNPAGQKVGELAIKEKENAASYVHGMSQAIQVGPVLLFWTGVHLQVHNLAGFEEKSPDLEPHPTKKPDAATLAKQQLVSSDRVFPLLWSVPLAETNDASRASQQLFAMRRNRIAGLMPGVGRATPQSPFWAMLALPECVCLQRERDLRCLDLLTGRVLWKREETSGIDADIVGDEQVVCVLSFQNPEARLFSTIDGRQLGQRSLPPRQQWVTIEGRQLVWFDEAHEQLVASDLSTEEVVWRRPFAKTARWSTISEREVALLETTGAFEIIDPVTGTSRFKSPLDPVPTLNSLHVLPSFDNYLVFVGVPATNVQQIAQVQTTQSLVNGPLYALSRRTQKSLWKTDCTNQFVPSVLPRDFPVIVASRAVQKSVPNGGGAMTHETLTQVINSRTGAMEFEDSGMGYFQAQTTMYVDRSQVGLKLRNNKLVKLNFAAQ